MIIFFDNDVILDVLLKRKDFKYSQRLLSLIEQKKIRACTSPIIFVNTFYIMSKLAGRKKAWSALQKLRLLFKISTIDEKMVDLALTSEFKGFEAALQDQSSVSRKVEYLVTRNKSDYVESGVTVVSPQEMLALLSRN